MTEIKLKPFRTLQQEIALLKAQTSFTTYKYYEYDMRKERIDEPIEFVGDTIIFVNVPNEVRIKFNEKENAEIPIYNPIKIWHLFYRFYISNEYYDTEEKLQFFVGINLDIAFINVKPDVRELIAKSSGIGDEASWTSEAKIVYNFNELIFTAVSDINGSLDVEWSNDGVNFDVKDTYPIEAEIGRGEVIEIKGKYVRFTFTKDNIGETQNKFRFLSFVR